MLKVNFIIIYIIHKIMVKDKRNLFRLKKEIDDTTIKYIRNLFRLKKNEAIKDRIIREIRTDLEHEQEVYYKAVREGNIWSKIYIEHESNGDRNKTLSVEEYLNKIRPYLGDFINNTWTIQLTIASNFMSSKDTDEEHVMH